MSDASAAPTSSTPVTRTMRPPAMCTDAGTMPLDVATRVPRTTPGAVGGVFMSARGVRPETPQKIHRHRATIFLRRTHVVDRMDFFTEHPRRFIDRRAAAQRRLGL